MIYIKENEKETYAYDCFFLKKKMGVKVTYMKWMGGGGNETKNISKKI